VGEPAHGSGLSLSPIRCLILCLKDSGTYRSLLCLCVCVCQSRGKMVVSNKESKKEWIVSRMGRISPVFFSYLSLLRAHNNNVSDTSSNDLGSCPALKTVVGFWPFPLWTGLPTLLTFENVPWTYHPSRPLHAIMCQ